MRRFRWFAVVILAFGLGSGTPINPAGAESDRPVRVVLTPTADPSTSQTVTWWTRKAFKQQRFNVREATGGPYRFVKGQRKPKTKKKFSGTSAPAYSATMTELKPHTRYEYWISHTAGRTKPRYFTTAASQQPPRWSLLAFGDTQVEQRQRVRPIIRRALRDEPHARLMLQTGDVVNHPYALWEWKALFAAMGSSRLNRNWVIGVGNHEQCVLVKNCDSHRGEAFKAHFTWPRNDFAKQGPNYYFTDYQGVRIIALDQFGGAMKRQARFLDRALRTNRQRWSIVVMHAGPFAARPDRSNPEVRRLWLPIFEKRKADVVLSGHDHSYARGYMKPGGPMYVTSVSGPKFYENGSKDWKRHGATRVKAAQATATYQVIKFAGDSLRYRAVVALKGKNSSTKKKLGQTLDRFTLTK